MLALIDLLSRSVLGLACCAMLAFSLSFVGHKTVARGEEVSCQLAIGHCRQCGNTIRFKPREWCATCRVCKQLTNIDQAQKFHLQKNGQADDGQAEAGLTTLAELR